MAATAEANPKAPSAPPHPSHPNPPGTVYRGAGLALARCGGGLLGGLLLLDLGLHLLLDLLPLGVVGLDARIAVQPLVVLGGPVHVVHAVVYPVALAARPFVCDLQRWREVEDEIQAAARAVAGTVCSLS